MMLHQSMIWNALASVVMFDELGWIEIAFSSNENRRYVKFGSMRVEAAGSVTRKIMVSGPSSGSYFVIESA